MQPILSPAQLQHFISRQLDGSTSGRLTVLVADGSARPEARHDSDAQHQQHPVDGSDVNLAADFVRCVLDPEARESP